MHIPLFGQVKPTEGMIPIQPLCAAVMPKNDRGLAQSVIDARGATEFTSHPVAEETDEIPALGRKLRRFY